MNYAQSWKLTASGASSVSEALSLVRQGVPFDAAIVDTQLPDAGCANFVQELQENAGRKGPLWKDDVSSLPLIALSHIGRAGRNADRSLFAAQLTIPIKSSQLYNALNAVLGIRLAHAGSTSSKSKTVRNMADQLPLRILLAEDNVINQKVAQHILGRLGYLPDVVANGREVIEALSRQAYDVVLMDMHMPEMDGMQATQLVRKQFPQSHQPAIIALTADAMQGDRERCMAAGMDNYLSKPLRIEELSEVLALTAVQHSRSQIRAAIVGSL
jgi:CheY-like chemotaxis protein